MKSIKDALPKLVEEVFNSPQFDDEAGIVIEAIKWESGNISIDFAFHFDGYNNGSKQIWQVTASGVEVENIKSEWAKGIELYSNHILLLEHKDIHTELYIKGVTANPHKLFLDLFQSITQLSDKLDEVSKYILYPDEVKRLSSQGHGLFARGSKTILKVYEQCLLKHGIKPIYIGEHEPLPKNKMESLKLLKIGNSYCIGHTFNFRKIR